MAITGPLYMGHIPHRDRQNPANNAVVSSALRLCLCGSRNEPVELVEMKELIMPKGLPASGKSTWSEEQVKANPGQVKIVSKDKLRAMLDLGKWSGSNEKMILDIRDRIISCALTRNLTIIVDDTNLDPKHEARLRELANLYKADFVIQDFTHVSLQECIDRDRKRPNYVGEHVIRDMYKRYLRKPLPQLVADPKLPWIVVCDLDGTLCLHWNRGPYEESKVIDDLPNKPVVAALQTLARNFSVMYVSGRTKACYDDTRKWLGGYVNIPDIGLFMREVGDKRHDTIVKTEIYEREIKGKFNVLLVLDDRQSVVDMWRELGLTVFQVADGNF